jgi:hypothetical protein
MVGFKKLASKTTVMINLDANLRLDSRISADKCRLVDDFSGMC